jgi:hypothetical protein
MTKLVLLSAFAALILIMAIDGAFSPGPPTAAQIVRHAYYHDLYGLEQMQRHQVYLNCLSRGLDAADACRARAGLWSNEP